MTDRFDLEGLGRSIAAVQDRRVDPDGSDEAVRWRIADAAAHRPRRRLGGGRTGMLAAAVALVVGAGIAIAWLSARPGGEAARLSFTVGDPPALGRPKDLLAASDRAPVVVRFSEGTKVLMHPMARGRILDLTDRGAEILVETGRVRFEVEHRPQARWQVRSGSFLIQVVGTKFDTDYDPRAEELAVNVDEGSVIVSGCALGPGRVVRAGERVRASCSSHARGAARASPEAPVPAKGQPAEEPGEEAAKEEANARSDLLGREAAPQEESARRAGVSRRIEGGRQPLGPPRSSGASAWWALAREGRYDEAWVAVRPTFTRECQALRASELWLLGDTARLSGHGREARRAYEALRERFRGTTAAADAAFALGRLATELDGDATAAERWFETHLGERPDGPLARSALGRILDLRLERGDRAGAAGVAREYLRRFPGGARAPAARAILLQRSGGEAPPANAVR